MRNQSLYDNTNKLKLGIFGMNCSSGLSIVNIPERWDAAWEKNVKVAQLADATGIECLIPNARWKGYGGASGVNLNSQETITWATGLLSKTKQASVFATVHVPLFHPIVVAKQVVTADHIGEGRIGLNIVCGHHQDEFEMFGMEQLPHDERYVFAQEWWEVVKAAWQQREPKDFEGRYFKLKQLISEPGPFGGQIPPMMNAGASPAGRDFAIRNSDFYYDLCVTLEESARKIAAVKQEAAGHGRTVQVWTPVSIVCRPTRGEVDDFLQYCVENADEEAMETLYRVRAQHSQMESAEVAERIRTSEAARAVIGRSHYPVFGDPDEVAEKLFALHKTGFDGVAFFFVNYLDEYPYFAQEVLPRLKKLGIRN